MSGSKHDELLQRVELDFGFALTGGGPLPEASSNCRTGQTGLELSRTGLRARPRVPSSVL